MRTPILVFLLVVCLASGAYHACWTESDCLSGTTESCVLEDGSCGVPALSVPVLETGLSWGEEKTFTIHVANNETFQRPIDAVFAIDHTGSMRDDLEEFRNTWAAITEVLKTKSEGNFRVALIPFANQFTHSFGPPKLPLPFQDFYADEYAADAAIQSGLAAIYDRVTGGEECRENSYDAIQYAVREKWASDWGSQLPENRWREQSLKLVYVITDAAVFTGMYASMRNLADEAKAKRIVVFGFTPDPDDPKYRSPCPPTCPRCTRSGSTCELLCSFVPNPEGDDIEVCESKCCSGNPSWLGVYTDKCEPDGGGSTVCADKTFRPGLLMENYQYCYDLINVTDDTGGTYFKSFDKAEMRFKITQAFEEVDFNHFKLKTRKVSGPGDLEISLPSPEQFNVEVCDVLFEWPDEAQDPPCKIRSNLKVKVPDGVLEGEYVYNVTLEADTGYTEELQIRVQVRTPVLATITYAATALYDRVLVFLNLTNTGIHKTLQPVTSMSSISCAGKDAKVFWGPGSDSVPPGESLTAVADCTGASMTSNGMSLRITEVSPLLLTGNLGEKVEIMANITNLAGSTLLYLDNAHFFTLTLNGAPLSGKDVVYLNGPKLYRIVGSLPAGAAIDGYNVLEVSISESGSSASDFALLRKGTPSLKVSSHLQLGLSSTEVLTAPDTTRTVSTAADPLVLGDSSLFTHTDFSLGGLSRKTGPELVVNHTLKRGFIMLRSKRKDDGTVTVPYNRTGALPATITRTVTLPYLMEHDLDLIGFSDGAIGASRLDPATNVLFGSMALPDASIDTLREGWYGPVFGVRLDYENYTLYRPGMLPFMFSSPEPIPSITVDIAAPLVNRTLTLEPGKGGIDEDTLFANATVQPNGGVVLEVHVGVAEEGTVRVNVSTDMRNEVIITVPYAEIEPFILDAPSSISAVPNLTTEFSLGISNHRPDDDTFRVCAKGDGVKVFAGDTELTSVPEDTGSRYGKPPPVPPCHEVTGKAGQRTAVNLTIELTREDAASLTLNVTSISDPLLERLAEIAVKPADFSKSAITLTGCRKNQWKLICSFQAINGGNTENTYRYAVMPDLMVGDLTYEQFTLGSKQSKVVDVSALLVACDISLEARANLLALGTAHFIGRTFASEDGYALTSGMDEMAAAFDTLAGAHELLGLDDATRTALMSAVDAFKSMPSKDTGDALATVAAAANEAFVASLKTTCTMSHAKKISANIMVCDTPLKVQDESTFTCNSKAFTLEDVKFPFDCDVEANEELEKVLEDGETYGVLIGQEAKLPIVVRNRMHFDLLFDFSASASYDLENALLEESKVLITSDEEHLFTVTIKLDDESDQRLYLKTTPSGMPKRTQGFEIELRPELDVKVSFDATPHLTTSDVEATQSIDLIVEVHNTGNSKETFTATLDGPIADMSSIIDDKIDLAPGESSNITVAVTTEKRGTVKGTLKVTTKSDESVVKDVDLSVTATAPEIIAKAPESLDGTGTIVVRNDGEMEGEVDVSITGDASSCVNLVNSSVVVTAGGSVSVALENECEEASEIEVTLEGAGFSKTFTLKVAAMATPEPSDDMPIDNGSIDDGPTPEAPEDEEGGMGMGPVIIVGVLLVIGGGVVVMKKKKAATGTGAAAKPGAATAAQNMQQGRQGVQGQQAAYGAAGYGAYNSNYMNRYPYYGRR